MSTAQRRLDVLRAIVVEYVNTKEPVASKAVAQSYVQGVSSATIRNDMGVLEDEGLIRRKSHENPQVITLYEEFLEKPLGQKSHELLHTTYKKRERY